MRPPRQGWWWAQRPAVRSNARPRTVAQTPGVMARPGPVEFTPLPRAAGRAASGAGSGRADAVVGRRAEVHRATPSTGFAFMTLKRSACACRRNGPISHHLTSDSRVAVQSAPVDARSRPRDATGDAREDSGARDVGGGPPLAQTPVEASDDTMRRHRLAPTPSCVRYDRRGACSCSAVRSPVPSCSIRCSTSYPSALCSHSSGARTSLAELPWAQP